MNKRTLEHSLLALVLSLALAAGAVARPAPNPQQSMGEKQPTVYTYVALFGVPRANWAEYEKSDQKSHKLYGSLVADGTLVAWGAASVEVHEGQGAPTHASWMSATSIGSILKALNSFMTNSPVESDINYTMHADQLLMSTNYGFKPGAPPSKYLLVQDWKPKAGQEEAMNDLLKKYRKADLEALLADGSINGYSFNTEAIHTASPGWVSLVVEFPSAESIDKFYDQIQTLHDKDPLYPQVFSSVIDSAEHRDHLLQVLDSGRK